MNDELEIQIKIPQRFPEDSSGILSQFTPKQIIKSLYYEYRGEISNWSTLVWRQHHGSLHWPPETHTMHNDRRTLISFCFDIRPSVWNVHVNRVTSVTNCCPFAFRRSVGNAPKESFSLFLSNWGQNMERGSSWWPIIRRPMRVLLFAVTYGRPGEKVEWRFVWQCSLDFN